jgi:hypothetical protein
VTDEAEVTSSSARAGTRPNHYARHTVSLTATIPRRSPKGCAIQNNRFWSKWRRDGDGPRSLKDLVKQVEKGTQVRQSGLDQVLAELKQHRDTTADPDLRSALAWLCNAQSRMANNPTAAHSRDVLLAAYEVNRILATAPETPR